MKKILHLLAAAICFGTLSTQALPQWDNKQNLDVTNLPSLLISGYPVVTTGLGAGAGYEQYVYYIVSLPEAIGSGDEHLGIWRWSNLGGWESVGDFGTVPNDSGTIEEPACITVHSNYLYVGGIFDGITGTNGTRVSANDIVKMNLDTCQWSAIGNDSFTNVQNGGISALTIDNAGNIYAGGRLNLYSPDPNDPNYPFGSMLWNPVGVLKWNGTNWAEIGAAAEPAGLDPQNPFKFFAVPEGSAIADLATDGTNIFVLGSFGGAWKTNGDFIPSAGIIKYDGTNWVQMGRNITEFTVGTNSYTGIASFSDPVDESEAHLDSLAIVGTNLFVTGNFSYPHPCIARFSTVSGDYLPCADLKLNGVTPPQGTYFDFGSKFLQLTAHDGKIYLAGDFDHVGSLAAESIASWTNDGSAYGSWANLASGISQGGTNVAWINYANGLVANSNAVFVPGYFDLAGGLSVTNDPSIARWMTGPDAGSPDSAFAPYTDGTIYDVAVQNDGKILIAGSFTHVNGTFRNQVARLNADGSLDTAFNPSSSISNYFPNPAYINCIAVDSFHRVYVGGDAEVIRLNSSGGLDQMGSPYAGTNFVIDLIGQWGYPGTALTFSGGGKEIYAGDTNSNGEDTLFVGGVFNNFGGASWVCTGDIGINSPNWDGWIGDWMTGSSSGLQNGCTVNTVLLTGCGLIAGGDCVSDYCVDDYGASDYGVVYAYNYSCNFRGGYDMFTHCLAQQWDGKILAGGDDWSGGGVLVRFNTDGTLDSSFNPNLPSIVYTLITQPNTRILAGGNYGVKCININGTTDSSLNLVANGSVLKMVQEPDGGIIAVGSFTSFGSETHTNIARFYP